MAPCFHDLLNDLVLELLPGQLGLGQTRLGCLGAASVKQAAGAEAPAQADCEIFRAAKAAHIIARATRQTASKSLSADGWDQGAVLGATASRVGSLHQQPVFAEFPVGQHGH